MSVLHFDWFWCDSFHFKPAPGDSIFLWSAGVFLLGTILSHLWMLEGNCSAETYCWSGCFQILLGCFFSLLRISERCFVEELQKSESFLSLPLPLLVRGFGRVREGKQNEMWCLLTEYLSLSLCQIHPSCFQPLPLPFALQSLKSLNT